MELSQRTGRLSIVRVLGRGTPVAVNLYPRAPNCQEDSETSEKGETRGRRSLGTRHYAQAQKMQTNAVVEYVLGQKGKRENKESHNEGSVPEL